jgi:hypothetical protein
MVDLLAVAAHDEGEGAANPGVRGHAHHFLVAHGRPEHPAADHLRGEPGVEHAFGRDVEMARDAREDGLFQIHRGHFSIS